jgi:chromosome segregation ATPase
VNEKFKSTVKEKERLENKFQNDLQMLATQYEAKLAAAQQAQTTTDYSDQYEDEATRQIRELTGTIQSLKSEVDDLKGKSHKQALDSQLERLKAKYPNADELAVKGWSMVLPDAQIEDLMEKSHNDNITRVKNGLNEIIEKKKRRSATPVPRGTPMIKLKPNERPKTLEEATKMAKQFLAGH